MSENNKNLASQLEEILQQLKDEDLAELPPDEILNMKKKLNPYGRTIEGSDKYLNFSITQIHHDYWRNFIISAMIGFLNRMNDEWKVPEGVPVTPVYEYLKDPSKVETPKLVLEKAYQPTIDDYEFNRKWMAKRVIVKEFLEEMFQFNPDEHVRSGYRPNSADTTRKPINTPAGQLAVEHHKRTDAEFRNRESLRQKIQESAKPSADTNDQPKQYKKIKKIIKCKNGKTKTIFTKVPIKSNDQHSNERPSNDQHSNDQQSDDQPSDDQQASMPVDKQNLKDSTIANTVREMLPPHDLFGRFKMYMTSNYEELRDFVRDAYCLKPELELAINPYSVHDTLEEAETFKKKHRNEVIAEIFTAHFGKWNFFDSFKEQREHTNFYNDNTIILEEMMKQLEADERLGQDLMKKRVEKVKAKNVIQTGPDAESFKKWREQNAYIKELGAKYIGDTVDDDIPDDAIQVDVWKVAKGGLEIAKEKFYTAAEAPTFVKEATDKALAQQGSLVAPAQTKKNN